MTDASNLQEQCELLFDMLFRIIAQHNAESLAIAAGSMDTMSKALEASGRNASMIRNVAANLKQPPG